MAEQNQNHQKVQMNIQIPAPTKAGLDGFAAKYTVNGVSVIIDPIAKDFALAFGVAVSQAVGMNVLQQVMSQVKVVATEPETKIQL